MGVLNVKECEATCAGQYKYFGVNIDAPVDGVSSCWCSNSVTQPDVSWTDPTDCLSSCGGDLDTVACGAYGYTAVYVNGAMPRPQELPNYKIEGWYVDVVSPSLPPFPPSSLAGLPMAKFEFAFSHAAVASGPKARNETFPQSQRRLPSGR